MPVQGVSTDFVRQQEDRMAQVIDAKDNHLHRLRDIIDALYRHHYIDEALYRDALARIDRTTVALLIAQTWGGWVMRYPPDLGRIK